MMRAGLTGGLGSGKSTAAALFGARGAVVLQSDAIGRDLMRPGEAVHAAITAAFGPEVLRPDGTLDRPALARLAFEQGRAEELNRIVHPAVIARQEQLLDQIAVSNPAAIVIIESALIFETTHGGPGGWRTRFDRMILVTAPESLKIYRFIERAGATDASRATLEAEARSRLALQMPDEVKAPLCDFVIVNDADLPALEAQVDRVWSALTATCPAQTAGETPAPC